MFENVVKPMICLATLCWGNVAKPMVLATRYTFVANVVKPMVLATLALEML